jgi:hypothetical protein
MEKKKQKYTNIKRILRKQVDLRLNVLWTWDIDDNNFTMIYKNYNDDLPIYTPQQLIEKIEASE